ncbi:MAG TPA: tautomerase family protein [Geobacterales bacterium]|jgi:phenylpyruvate tautomerase PptA (4-oxalocrotonate tautomerase family)|nr:tautomerase family protein [Geobacterales bacterium]
MPLTRVALRRGKSAEYKRAILDGIYAAMRESFSVPEDDRFMLIDEYDAENIQYSYNYPGIAHSDDLLIIQLTVNNTRTVEQKKALYARIVEKLTENPGVRQEDVLINLVEVAKENWSFGIGVAQYAHE